MRTGRPRLSDDEKVARATYRIDRQGLPSKAVEVEGEPQKPHDLSATAAKVWDQVVPDLYKAGVVTFVDAAELTQLCQWWVESQRIHEVLAVTDVGDKAYFRLLMMAATADKQFRGLADKFGLNPLDRGRLRIRPNEEKNELQARQR
jgi:P27 family predicted phage terminase small subunit